MKTKEISLDSIDYSRTQMRVRVDQDHVNEMAAHLRDGGTLPPVRLIGDSVKYYAVDGIHRILAHKAADLGTVPAIVEKGTERDAILAACGVNSDHGLKRTNADKRKAVETVLADPEWARESNVWVAERCKVTDKTVAKIREEVQPRISEVDTVSTRLGRDGKERPASSPRPKKITGGVTFDTSELEDDPQPVAEPEEQVESKSAQVAESSPGGVVDCLGRPVPDNLVPAMQTAAAITGVRNLLTQAKRELNRLRTLPGGEHLPQCLKLDEFDAMVRYARFATTCPECGGSGCNPCRMLGWLRYGHNLSDKQKSLLAEFDLSQMGK